MTDLTAVSLFAGIGGFDLALQRSGVKVVAAVEIDPAARSVLARRFPDTKLFKDVTEVTGEDLLAAGFVPGRGIITAGWPCTDLSVAGHRVGMGEGTRSGLYWHVDRLVGELRPAWVFYENVPGLLSSVCPCPGTGEHDGCAEAHQLAGGSCPGGCFPAHGGAMGLVLGSMADRGLGFAYRIMDAQYAGVPQQRRRVLIVGRAGGDARGPAEVLLEPEGREGDLASGGQTGQDVAEASGVRAGDGRAADGTGRGAHVVGTLTTSSVGGIGGPDDNTAQAGHLVAYALTAREGKGPDSDATTNLLSVDGIGVRRLTPLECERLQGYPDNWTEGQSDAARYRECGNSVAVPVIERVSRRIVAVDARLEAAA